MKTEPLHAADPDGRAIIGVPLSNAPEKVAWLYADDYEQFVKRYGVRSFHLNKYQDYGYVKFQPGDSRGPLTVASAIMGRPHRCAILYCDGDTLNLRRSNLTVSTGRAGVRSRKPKGTPQ